MKTAAEWARDCMERIELAHASGEVSGREVDVIEAIVREAVAASMSRCHEIVSDVAREAAEAYVPRADMRPSAWCYEVSRRIESEMKK